MSALWMQWEYSGSTRERPWPINGGRIPLRATSWWICLRVQRTEIEKEKKSERECVCVCVCKEIKRRDKEGERDKECERDRDRER